MKKIDATGLACPRPVLLARNAIREEELQSLEVLVDNKVATENLTKLSQQVGYEIEVQQEAEDLYRVLLSQGEAPAAEPQGENPLTSQDTGDYMLVFNSEFLGQGDPELGAILMESYIHVLTGQDRFPKVIFFYNSGVKIPTQNEAAIFDLKLLASKGVEIYACGLCLDFYHLADQLQVGSPSNLFELARLNTVYPTINPC
ncbi:MAG: sulfurtransferase-like selenium metabolism protein YedF [Tissierellia bacterium]|nr:sulfurtransferase-like selenium metabolism protein YedF [Tissierellia bacterium]